MILSCSNGGFSSTFQGFPRTILVPCIFFLSLSSSLGIMMSKFAFLSFMSFLIEMYCQITYSLSHISSNLTCTFKRISSFFCSNLKFFYLSQFLSQSINSNISFFPQIFLTVLCLIFKHYSMLPYLFLKKKKNTHSYLYITFTHYNTKHK